MQERLQKVINKAGLASRREAEGLIKAGQVAVNGKIAKLGDKADVESDKISVRGKLVAGYKEKIYLALNKPVGFVTTRTDPLRRKTVYDLLPASLRKHVWPVGRLDYNTSGLLILTNDGDFTQKLTHPSFELEKAYQAKLHRTPTAPQLSKLKKGVSIDGRKVMLSEIEAKGKNISLTLHEGRNRIVRRLLAIVGLEVLELERLRVGKLTLPPKLAPGEFLDITSDRVL